MHSIPKDSNDLVASFVLKENSTEPWKVMAIKPFLTNK